MDEMNLTLPPELETALTGFYSASEPDAAFATRLELELRRRQSDLLEPVNPSRFPFWFKRSSFMLTLRTRPALLILFIFLALTLLTGVVYAVGRSLGYIPGVGLVEQGTPIRVLAEPVLQTRDGITLTVSEAMLTTDKTVVLFSLENVPWSALSHDENVVGCSDMPWLSLANGTRLTVQGGSAQMRQSRMVYSAIAVDINEATLNLPCIQNTMPGLAPENWQVALRFKPAPADLIIEPVIEIQPTETALPVPGKTVSPTETPAVPSPLILMKALQVSEDTILLFSLKQSGAGGWIEFSNLKLTDANGKEVFTSNPAIEDLPVFDRGIQFKSNVSFPVTVSISGVPIAPVLNSAAEFEFDASDNPQPGQEWMPNQSIQIGGRTVTLTTIQADSQSGYNFIFTCDSDVSGLSLQIAGYTPNGGGGGGGPGVGQFGVSVAYAELPKGKLRVLLSNLSVAGPEQTWSMQWSPENAPAAAALYGITLKLDKFIPIQDGYYLVGHTEWTDKRIAGVSGLLQAWDASGRELALETVDNQNAPISVNDNQWAYKISGKAFAGPVTLKAKQMSIEFASPVSLTLDMRPYSFSFSDDRLGIPFKIGITALDVPGLSANAFKATYIKEGEMRGFEIALEADPALLGLTFGISGGLDTSGMQKIGSSGSSFRDEKTGLLISRIATDAPLSFPLLLDARLAQIGGEWTVSWNPPAAEAGAVPYFPEQACLTLDQWKQAAANPPAIPADLPGRVLVSRGAISPDPSLFLASLDGKLDRPLVFGRGALLADGSRLVYADENGSIQTLELASGQKQKITGGMDFTPFWSPDGKQIAYMHQTDKGMNIFVMDANGQNQTALTDVTTNPELRGWATDGRNLVIVAAQGAESQIALFNMATKEFIPLVPTRGVTWEVTVSLSSDGQWLAYTEKVTGRIGAGLYISRLDGSERRLLVQLDYWPVYLPVWSPDGKWLAFSVSNNDLPDGLVGAGLINVDTCQVVPLPAIQGEIHGWVR